MKTLLLVSGIIAILWLAYAARLHTLRTQFPVCDTAQQSQNDKTRCYQEQWWWHSAI